VAKTRKNLSAKTAPNTKPFAMGMAAGRLSASSLAAAKRGAAPAQASLSINCIPTGADIEIDGAFVGNTPSIVSVVPGTHQITVKKSGYTGWSKTLSVTGGTIQLNAELEPEPAKQ
jgi:CRISPR/Cas system-associated exonuclease Cas4 (RecB family)